MYKFYYLGCDTTKIENNDFIKIYVLDLENKFVHSIYKLNSNKNLVEKLSSIKVFDNITNFVTFAIKRNGKISLDIKLV